MDADPEGAFHDFQQAAAQGDPYAIFNVGYMYLRVGPGAGGPGCGVRGTGRGGGGHRCGG